MHKKCVAFFDDFFHGYEMIGKSIFLRDIIIPNVLAIKNDAEFYSKTSIWWLLNRYLRKQWKSMNTCVMIVWWLCDDSVMIVWLCDDWVMIVWWSRNDLVLIVWWLCHDWEKFLTDWRIWSDVSSCHSYSNPGQSGAPRSSSSARCLNVSGFGELLIQLIPSE